MCCILNCEISKNSQFKSLSCKCYNTFIGMIKMLKCVGGFVWDMGDSSIRDKGEGKSGTIDD